MKIFKTLVRIAALAFATQLGVLPALANQESGTEERWIATWATALETADALDHFAAEAPQLREAKVAPADAANRTLREVVRISTGGTEVRIRLANIFGAAPLQVGAAHIAIRGSGSTTVAGTDRTLTFSGQPSFKIPVGAVIVSDPVALAVAPSADVAVSLYFPDAPDLNSMHYARMTNFLSEPGDHTGDGKFPLSRSLQAWHVLERVEVSAKSTPLLVAFGDSITDGAASTLDANQDWPAQFSRRVQDAKIDLGVVNEGIGGNRILHDMVGTNALARFDRDVATQTGACYMVFLEGINDIVLWRILDRPDEKPTAEAIIGGMKQIILRAHSHGIRIFGGTLLPLGGSRGASPEVEELRQKINEWIRSANAFDAVIDFDAALRDPADATRLAAGYSSADHVHPSDAGYQAMAETVDLRLIDSKHVSPKKTWLHTWFKSDSGQTANQKTLGLP